MKKLLLFVMAVMAFAGMSVAQTVYVAGMYTNAYGNDAAVVVCNGEIIQDISTAEANYRCRDVVLDSQHNMYWVLNQYATTNNVKWGDIRKNDDPYLENNSGTEIYALAVDVNDNLYSVGTKKVGSGVDVAAIWVNDNSTPYAQHGDGINTCLATGVVCNGTDVYFCGYEYWNDASKVQHYNGFVWRNDETEPILTLSEVRIYDIDFYDEKIYVVGEERVNNGEFITKVYEDGAEIYVVAENGRAIGPDAVKVDCGNVYFTTSSSDDGYTEHNSIWQNDEEYHPDGALYLKGLDVTPDGVYYTVTTGDFFEGYHSAVYKDTDLLWAPEKLQWVDHMYVAPAACDNETRNLPYYEDFEIGETDWTCWTAEDLDEQIGGYASYWHRGGARNFDPASGDYFAWHEWSPYEQEGWLVSPVIKIPEGGAVTLTFQSYEEYAGDYRYEGVWIGSENNNIGEEVWHPTSEEVSDEWKPIEIDLSAYRGQEIQIGFRYAGENGHSWYIDDISITQEGAPKYTITAMANPIEGGTVMGGGEFSAGETCTLAAIPSSGYTFINWNDGNTENPRNIVVTENAIYTANFTQGGGGTTYTISANVTPADAGTVSGTGSYAAGATATLTAIPAGGYQFAKWDDGNTDNPRQFQVYGNIVVTAIFETAQYTVTVSANPAEGGVVTGGGSFSYGQTTTLMAIANAGYTFVGWSDGSTENPHTVTVTASVNYVATFSQGSMTYYTVTAFASPNGAGTVEGSGPYPAGSQVILTAVPALGYSFLKWNDEVTDNPRIFTITGDVTLLAIFSGLGVEENDGKVIALYPNPATESLHITGLEANSEVQIYNSIGMLVKTVNVDNDEEINISELSDGLYVVRCGNATMRFVKK